MMNRRRFLLTSGLGSVGLLGTAGVTGALVEAEVLPGKIRLDHALGRCGDSPPLPTEHAVVRQETFHSTARGRAVRIVVATPSGAGRGLPVVIALHGLGGNAGGILGHAHDRFLAHATARGLPGFAIVGVEGGSTYWHPRASGDNPQRMIVDEVLPRLDRMGLRTGRVGLMGWSMGGYGALLLAQALGPSRVSAVVASSPAVFLSHEKARAANPNAFDDLADFRRHDVIAGLARLRGIPAWVDCGLSDPFADAARRVRAGLAAPAGGLYGGCHDGRYWQRRAPGQLAFLGRHL